VNQSVATLVHSSTEDTVRMGHSKARMGRSGRAAAVALLAAAVASSGGCHPVAPPIEVSVGGKTASVPAGMTVGALLNRVGLHLRAGNLLDVHGDVIRPHAYAGQVLMNGKPVPVSTPLSPGAVITLRDGEDRTESEVTVVEQVPGTQAPNPQFYLGTVPGELVVRKGEISGEVVSSDFRATGSYQQPKAVALTFDDGPSYLFTRRFLAVLKRFHVTATFFVIGKFVQQYPDIVKSEAEAGMVVANHSWSHPNYPPFRKLPAARIRQEVADTEHLLLGMGISSAFFRPPGGSYSPTVIEAARTFDNRVVLWSVDPKDWERGRSAASITAAVLAHVEAGSIVDLHDGGPNSQATLEALPAIIQGIRARGLDLVALTP
jgi:peptidoglycan/xylan/chitin deacetylase (PgdA/CDA1 family)/sulfur carrier protein ThiS